MIDDIVILPEKIKLLMNRLFGIMRLQVIVACDKNVLNVIKKEEWLRDNLNLQLQGLDTKDAKLMVQRRIKSVGGYGLTPFEDHDIQNIVKKAIMLSKEKSGNKMTDLKGMDLNQISSEEEEVKEPSYDWSSPKNDGK